MPLSPTLQQHVRDFTDWWKQQRTAIDRANAVVDPLYHYTDMGGLRGIITSEQVWFTSIFHLNDPSELSYGIQIARDILEAESNTSGNRAVKNFCAWMDHLLIKSGGEIIGFFVASFSRAPNHLGQWRAYADNGRGVAIGLAPKLFEVVSNTASLTVPEMTFVARVSYDRSELVRNLTEAIRFACAAVISGDGRATSPAEQQAFGKEVANELAAPIYWYCLSAKHAAYEHEQETRLFLLNDYEQLAPFTETRTRGPALVPYVPSPMRVRQPDALTKIIVGPAADPMAIDAVHALLRRHSLPLDIVERSDIPYTAR